MSWNASRIGHLLARTTFKGQLVAVPNCNWTGHECDLLVVTPKLMLVDVEVKISRADFKADAKKDKWWERYERVQSAAHGYWYHQRRTDPVARLWPPKVWKYWVAMPRRIWAPDLIEFLPTPAAGVILCGTERHPEQLVAEVIRRPRACPNAQPISAAHAVDIARLASLRMWDALCSPAAANTQEVIA